jgi:hypothetical protein
MRLLAHVNFHGPAFDCGVKAVGGRLADDLPRGGSNPDDSFMQSM